MEPPLSQTSLVPEGCPSAQGIIVWRISKIFDLLSYSKMTLDQSCLPPTLSSDKSEDIGVLSF